MRRVCVRLCVCVCVCVCACVRACVQARSTSEGSTHVTRHKEITYDTKGLKHYTAEGEEKEDVERSGRVRKEGRRRTSLVPSLVIHTHKQTHTHSHTHYYCCKN